LFKWKEELEHKTKTAQTEETKYSFSEGEFLKKISYSVGKQQPPLKGQCLRCQVLPWHSSLAFF